MDIATKTDTSDQTVHVFVSYAREDKKWFGPDDRHNLVPFLKASLERQDVVFWYDERLIGGDQYQSRIEEEIDHADMVILLVSQYFFNSGFIRNVELPRIESRAQQGQVVIVPVVGGRRPAPFRFADPGRGRPGQGRSREGQT